MSTMFIPPPVPEPAFKRRGREVRGLFGTLVVIFLLGTGVAYGGTWYQRGQLEEDATRDARKVAVRVLQPMLLPSDVTAPIRGDRYDQLLSLVQERVLAGPINRVRLWRADGTVLFADDASVVGKREPAMRDDIHAVNAGTSESDVKGERYRTLTSVRVGDPARFLVVELDQPHASIVQRANKQWRPWMIRAGVGAGICAVLYIATAIGLSMYGAVVKTGPQAKPKRAKSKDAKPKPTVPTREDKSVAAPNGKGQTSDVPGYMQPGYQEEVQARRRVEEALQTVERQRDELRERVRRLEAELEAARGTKSERAPAGRTK